MESKKPLYQLVTGEVNESEEHIALDYGSYNDSVADQFIPVARVCKSGKKFFKVEFFIKPDSPEEKKIIDEVNKELDFYLIEIVKNGYPGNPWYYAINHCGSSANVYSKVHWTYFPEGSGPGKKGIRSEVITEEKTDDKGKVTKERLIFKPNMGF
ncbi:MAG: hypothetical protein JXL81_09730 [Deltaproteobacteria bacterium]|nr:hypothetical protein [Deltaproteobacteria bacterium]